MFQMWYHKLFGKRKNTLVKACLRWRCATLRFLYFLRGNGPWLVRANLRWRTATLPLRLEVLEDRVLLDGSISTVDGLIAAIKAANASGQAATITLASGTTFQLTTADNKTDGANGLPVITGDITIEGTFSQIQRIDNNQPAPNNNPFRIFDVAKGASLTLDNLELKGGLAYGSGAAAEGGAIYNQGTLAFSYGTIDSCNAIGSDGYHPTGKAGAGRSGGNGQDAFGGGIYNAGGSLTIVNSDLSNNDASGGAGGGGGNGYSSGVRNGGNGGSGGNGFGGGIYNAGGSLSLVNSDLSVNHAAGGLAGGGGVAANTGYNGGAGGAGGSGSGGGLYVSGGTVFLVGHKVEGNLAGGGVGGAGGTGASGGVGGNGSGGGLYVGGGIIYLNNVTMTSFVHEGGANGGAGGNGGAGAIGGTGGDGGNGNGGGLYAGGGIINLGNVTMSNDAEGGNGGNGGDGTGGEFPGKSGIAGSDGNGSDGGLGGKGGSGGTPNQSGEGDGGNGGNGGNSSGADIYQGAATVNTGNNLTLAVTPTKPTWDTSKGEVDFGYQVTGMPVYLDTEVALYWATSDQWSVSSVIGSDPSTNTMGKPFYTKDIPFNTQVGTYGPFSLSADQLGPPPDTANYLLVVTDPNNVFGNFDASKNVAAVAIPTPTITPTQPKWDTNGGVDWGYQISGGTVQKATQVELYWSPFGYGNALYTKDIPVGTQVGTYGPFYTSAGQLGAPPENTKALLVVTDPNNVLGNFDPTKNIASLAYAPQWTGDGSDDLWSDGNNWLGGFVPQAGDDLLFPTGAKQLSSNNDLGYSFNSITVQDSYEFSGKTLAVTGAFDVQQGSVGLDCSATVGGTTTVETGASLTMKAGTLDVLKQDPLIVVEGGSLKIDAGAVLKEEDGSETDVSGNLTVAKNGILSVLGGATMTGENGSKTDLSGNLTVAKNGKMTLAGGATMTEEDGSETDIAGNLTVDKNGTVSVLGGATMTEEDGSETDLSGNLTVAKNGTVELVGGATMMDEDGSETDVAGNLTVDKDGTMNVAGNAVVTGEEGSTTSVSGNLTVAKNGKYSLLAGSTFEQQNGVFTINGEVDSGGTFNVTANGKVKQSDGGDFIGTGTVTNQGDWSLSGTKTFPDQTQLTLEGNGKMGGNGTWTIGVNTPGTTIEDVLEVQGRATFTPGKGATLLINVTGKFSDSDAVTVEAGANVDVYGTWTEGTGGSLDVLGTVTIESGATLSNSTKITIEAGGVLDVLGEITVDQAGSLDIFGTVTVHSNAASSFVGPVTVESGGALNQFHTSSTSTALSVSPTTPLAGVNPVTLTATVTDLGTSNGTPIGMVDFIDTTTGTDLGRAALVNGVASLNAGPFASGNHTITANYSGNSDFLSSSNTATLTAKVPPSPPATAPTPKPPPLQVPPLLAFFNSFLSSVETINSNGTTAIADSIFGIPLIVSIFDHSGKLMSVTLLGIDITFLFA